MDKEFIVLLLQVGLYLMLFMVFSTGLTFVITEAAGIAFSWKLWTACYVLIYCWRYMNNGRLF